MLLAMLAFETALLAFGKIISAISAGVTVAVSGMGTLSLVATKNSIPYCTSSMAIPPGGGSMTLHSRKPARLLQTNHRPRQSTLERVTAPFFANSLKGGIALV